MLTSSEFFQLLFLQGAVVALGMAVFMGHALEFHWSRPLLQSGRALAGVRFGRLYPRRALTWTDRFACETARQVLRFPRVVRVAAQRC